MQTPSSESQAVVQILGTDAWARFDLWSSRAWDAAQGAISVAESSGPVSSENGIDNRVVAYFHASGVAKEFAAMVNPLFAVSGMGHISGCDDDEISDVEYDILFDNEDGQ